MQAQGDKISTLVDVLTELQNAQVKADAFQAKIAEQLNATDEVIDDLKRRVNKDSPRHKLPKTGADTDMTDTAATLVPPSPPTPSSQPSPAATTPQLAQTRPCPPPAASSNQRPRPADSDEGCVVLVIFPKAVVPHMMRHFQALLDLLPQRVADDALFRTPTEGTTFGVKFSALDSSYITLPSVNPMSAEPAGAPFTQHTWPWMPSVSTATPSSSATRKRTATTPPESASPKTTAALGAWASPSTPCFPTARRPSGPSLSSPPPPRRAPTW